MASRWSTRPQADMTGSSAIGDKTYTEAATPQLAHATPNLYVNLPNSCNAAQWIRSEKATASISRSEKVIDILCDEHATRIVGLYSNDWYLGEVAITSVRVTEDINKYRAKYFGLAHEGNKSPSVILCRLESPPRYDSIEFDSASCGLKILDGIVRETEA